MKHDFRQRQERCHGSHRTNQGMAFSADEGADVGSDQGTAVAKAYAVPFKFNGKIGKITIELKGT